MRLLLLMCRALFGLLYLTSRPCTWTPYPEMSVCIRHSWEWGCMLSRSKDLKVESLNSLYHAASPLKAWSNSMGRCRFWSDSRSNSTLAGCNDSSYPERRRPSSRRKSWNPKGGLARLGCADLFDVFIMGVGAGCVV